MTTVTTSGINNNSSTDSNDKDQSQSNNATTSNSTNTKNKMAIHLIVGLREICLVTLFLPLGGLFVCFVTGYIFQAEEIHETHCRVYNIIPSISAITGISPQRYLWRICIALHITPRFIIAFVYKNYYQNILNQITDQNQYQTAKRLLTLVHWLSLIEISALTGVTYVSNKENYPIHEKIFIVFMTTSLCYMLATLKLLKVINPTGPLTPTEEMSLKCKKMCFALSIASTIGLIIFFLKHRFLCHDMAFSWFAFCEYVVAISNMGFHCTTMIDFPSEQFLVVQNGTQLKQDFDRLHNESQLEPEPPHQLQSNDSNKKLN